MPEPAFRIVIEGHLDTDGDGAPEVVFDADMFGLDVARVRQNLPIDLAFKLFGAVVNLIKGFLSR